MISLFFKLFIFLIAIISTVKSADDKGHGWNYDVKGPDAWPHEFENCKGKKQSPINIETDKVEYDRNLKQFAFSNYLKSQNWNVSHNGHTVVVSQINDETKARLTVKGSDFVSEYELLQFHFHWGINDYQGSEHYIDSDKFPLELHLVHKSKQGFTVLGFLFKLSAKDNVALKPLLDSVAIAKNQSFYKEATFSLSSILPELSNLDRYYRYLGSLTTPPCTEGVKWNLFVQTIEISHAQLQSFRNNDLKLNFRDPQKLYGRKVFSSFQTKKSKNSHSKPHSTSNASYASISLFLNLVLIGVSSVFSLF